MESATIRQYKTNDFEIWNKFLLSSKNTLFLHNRNYMDYHSSRFIDCSLIFEDDNSVVALLPANRVDDTLISHSGLTYGGLILDNSKKQKSVMDYFYYLIEYCKKSSIRKIVYKPIPHIFHKQPAEEDLYALKYYGGTMVEVSASTVIDLEEPLKMTKSRKSQISRARREGVVVKEVNDLQGYSDFLRMEETILFTRHNVHAVHTPNELFMLHERFPNQIRLLGAFQDNQLIAGAVIYVYDTVVHTQYLAANEIARRIGGLDLVINHIIDSYRGKKKWLDFGVSTEKRGRYLNEGLIWQKESFGGRTNVYTCWELVLE